nr:MAG TPA: hypothetical protein [Caudoviricetes sp.]
MCLLRHTSINIRRRIIIKLSVGIAESWCFS